MIPVQVAQLGPGAPRRGRRTRLLAVVAVLAVLAAAVTGAVTFAGSGGSARAGRTTGGSGGTGGTGSRGTSAPSPVAADALPALGVYAGPGAVGTVEAVDQALGGKVSYAMDFLPQTSWTALTDPAWLVAAWAGHPFDMVLGVPMLPDHGATLAQGARGAYDGEFTLLAQHLVAAGLGGAVLLVGWQPDDAGTPWYVRTAAAAGQYVRYWDRIVAAMKAVPGASFVFEWDPGDSGSSPVPPASMYPGNAAVDVVGTDAFDVVPHSLPQSEQWASVLDRTGGPTWAATFAAEHHRLLAVAMWGVVPVAAGGGGDAPEFVSSVLAWAARQGVTMCVLWDYGSWAISGGEFPSAYAGLAAAVGPGANAGSGGSSP